MQAHAKGIDTELVGNLLLEIDRKFNGTFLVLLKCILLIFVKISCFLINMLLSLYDGWYFEFATFSWGHFIGKVISLDDKEQKLWGVDLSSCLFAGRFLQWNYSKVFYYYTHINLYRPFTFSNLTSILLRVGSVKISWCWKQSWQSFYFQVYSLI